MKIALHNSDKTRFPNLALMKLSYYHKSKGDNISWFEPLFGPYDKVYSSKVFTFNKQDPYLPKDAIKGGTGYNIKSVLPDEIDCMCPDYSLYGIDYSIGFLTRGCKRKCKFCIVPKKEGKIRAYMDIEDFLRHDKVVLLDNNILAHNHGIEQLEKISRIGIKIDINQGVDCRLIDEDIAKLFSKIKWIKPVVLACDSPQQKKSVARAVKLLRAANVTPKAYSCLMLVKDVEEAHERAEFLHSLGVDPFAQPFRHPDGTPPTKEQKHFARWVNHKAIFKTVEWKDYKNGGTQ